MVLQEYDLFFKESSLTVWQLSKPIFIFTKGPDGPLLTIAKPERKSNITKPTPLCGPIM